MTSVKLTRAERNRIARVTRKHVRAVGFADTTDPATREFAATTIENHVDGLGRFDDVPFTEISDYAHAFARFLYPKAVS